ncbi:MAG: adenosine kinase [Pseudomonadota bacterium]
MYDLYGLGNALVDMEYIVDESFLATNDVAKGHMTLVDEPRLMSLIAALETLEPRSFSGGSAANSVIAAQAMGARSFYSCRLADDDIGAFFIREMRANGIDLNNNAGADQADHSGRCLVLITPDAERSMNTYLGISAQLGLAQLDEDALRQSRYFYVEGYMSASETAMAATLRARELADEHGVKSCISLSDPSMATIFGDQLRAMFGNGAHIVFCNEEEALTLTGTDRVDIALNELRDMAREVHLTLGPRGSIYADAHRQVEVAGYPVEARDSTGAGDAFAGACLYALAAGMEGPTAAALGNFTASTVVGQFGARLHTPAEYQALLKRFEP